MCSLATMSVRCTEGRDPEHSVVLAFCGTVEFHTVDLEQTGSGLCPGSPACSLQALVAIRSAVVTPDVVQIGPREGRPLWETNGSGVCGRSSGEAWSGGGGVPVMAPQSPGGEPCLLSALPPELALQLSFSHIRDKNSQNLPVL